ncbi:bifunctional 2-polyprenyl-6-hydroxyphenol methylase/3-demethylubiquinol 3-O-methyltransferase UbiG [Sphingopyxis sp.]|uniref:class I SAM-dependent methyltransferase n=1 Tax=Sphingopyxis sp. TaxID=1908224 RepID=UPI00261CB96F|nr:class I SAM-dependent methyltransferase [Sphingopyxis sp.]MCW0197333.1 class I SAM-dependent methyltransferase [Sphingopyxis sp.]
MSRLSDSIGFDPATLAFYTKEAPDYAASGPGGVSRWLASFLGHLPDGSRILELGCGSGRDAEAMIAAGHDVDATDGTPEMAALASTRLGRTVRVMRFDALDAHEAYDAVWAHACLLHVPFPALPGILTRVFRALRPGGVHFATYKGGGTAGRDAAGRYFNYPDAGSLRAAYEAAAPWQISAIEDYVGGGYDGRQGPWLAISVRRPDD